LFATTGNWVVDPYCYHPLNLLWKTKQQLGGGGESSGNPGCVWQSVNNVACGVVACVFIEYYALQLSSFCTTSVLFVTSGRILE